MRNLVALLVIGSLAAMAGGPAAAEDAATVEEAPLTGEAKKAHDKQVRALLKTLEREKNKEIVRGRIERIGTEGTRVGRDALFAFVPGNKNQAFVAEAFTALGKIGDRPSVEFLTGKHALRNKNFLVAQSAAHALEEVKSDEATAALLDVMTHKRTKIEVVGACAKALAKSAPEDERAFEEILKLTNHRKDTIRSYALEALGSFKTDAAVTRLLDALENDKNTRARGAAATGLGATMRPEVIEALEAQMGRDKSLTVKTACMDAIKKIQGGDA